MSAPDRDDPKALHHRCRIPLHGGWVWVWMDAHPFPGMKEEDALKALERLELSLAVEADALTAVRRDDAARLAAQFDPFNPKGGGP